jgi:hypothetical protein
MTKLMRLGVEWGLDRKMMLAGPSVQDFCKQEGNLLDLWAGFASMKNLGGSSTQGCKFQSMGQLTAFGNC